MNYCNLLFIQEGESSNRKAVENVNGKVKAVLGTKHHAIRTYRGMEVQILSFLTSALDRRQGSASLPGKSS
jgi:hypothetical protein